EINTLRGNVAWMRARETILESTRFAGDVRDLAPIVQPRQSDSACLDNVAELLLHSGRPLAHAMMMLVPEAWERDETMSPERRAVKEQRGELSSLIAAVEASVRPEMMSPSETRRLQRTFGYTREELAMIVAPMGATGEEPIGSMGNDTPLAVLSDESQLLF